MSYLIQVGYTGDPFSRCIDIDECGYADLNTCSGGMNPNGISADMTLYMDENRIFYLGETEADGYSQAVQFELKGNVVTKLFFNTEDTGFDEQKVYRIASGAGKFQLWYESGLTKEGPWTNKNKFTYDEFRSYVFRYVIFPKFKQDKKSIRSASRF